MIGDRFHSYALASDLVLQVKLTLLIDLSTNLLTKLGFDLESELIKVSKVG